MNQSWEPPSPGSGSFEISPGDATVTMELSPQKWAFVALNFRAVVFQLF